MSATGLPTPPTDLTGLSDEQVRELAVAYLDLLRLMNSALNECDHNYGFFSWSGRGYHITGHPPVDLVDLLREQS